MIVKLLVDQLGSGLCICSVYIVHVCEESCVGSRLFRVLDSGSPHYVAVVDGIHPAHKFVLASYFVRAFVNDFRCGLVGAVPVSFSQADAGLDAQCDISVDVGLVSLVQGGCNPVCQTYDGGIDVRVNLFVDDFKVFSGLSCGTYVCRLRIDRHAWIAPSVFVRHWVVRCSGEPGGKVEIGECPDGIGLPHYVGHVSWTASHRLLGRYDVVGIGYPLVVGVPYVV